MRKRFLNLAAVLMALPLVGCGGGDAAPTRTADGNPTPEQQKEIDEMKANMKVGKQSHTQTPQQKEIEDMKAKMLQKR